MSRSTPTIARDGRGGARPSPVTVLHTARLTLRPFADSDVDDLVRLLNDREVVRFLAMVPHPYRTDDARDWVARTQTAPNPWPAFAIDADGALIGSIGLKPPEDPSSPESGAELGYWLGRPYWGKGYATEAASQMVGYAFSVMQLAQLWASVSMSNAASRRVLEKVGLRFVGETAVHYPARNTTWPSWLFAVGRQEWRASQAMPMRLVAAVALIDADGRVLVARRPEGRPMAGLWEFPGGKIEPGETPEAGLIRELKEELGIDVTESCLAPLFFASHTYDDFHLLMPLFVCRVWDGIVAPREGQELKWAAPAALADLAMPPADEPLVPLLHDFL